MKKYLTVRKYKMANIRITKIKSTIGATKRQINTLQALGLRKIGSVAEHTENEQIKGMIRKVHHLVKIENI